MNDKDTKQEDDGLRSLESDQGVAYAKAMLKNMGYVSLPYLEGLDFPVDDERSINFAKVSVMLPQSLFFAFDSMCQNDNVNSHWVIANLMAGAIERDLKGKLKDALSDDGAPIQ